MPTYKGPCEQCGNHVERYRRPGKPNLCVECAIRRAANQHLAMHDGTDPQRQLNQLRGGEYASQYARQEGEWYEKWRRGMTAYLTQLDHSVPAESAKVRAKPHRKRTRKS